MPRLTPVTSRQSTAQAGRATSPTLNITADFALPAAVKTKIAQQARTAYAYVARFHHWQASAALKAPVNVHVLTQVEMNKRFPGAAAYCTGPDDIYVQEKVGAPSFAGLGVLAHELTHLEHNRMKRGSLPQYMEEGLAVFVQRTAMQHFNLFDPKLLPQRKLLAAITPAQARATLDHFRTGADERGAQLNGELRTDESVGALFVSFLKSQLGERDVAAKFGRVMEELPAELRTSPDYEAHLDRAFQREFGLSATAAENDFVDFIRATAGRPNPRFFGTIWAQ